jgi:hypothetical protein
VLVAKPSSHPTLRAAGTAAEGADQTQAGQWTEGPGVRQRTYTYRLVRHLPLARESAGRVTEVELWDHTATGEVLSHTSWIPDLDVEAANVAVVVQLGRARWKVENEQVNVHKNHGYDLTRTYGHGQQTLSLVFYLLNPLASVAPVVLALGDRLYQRCRTQESRRELGNALRALVNVALVGSGRHWLEVYLEETDARP